MAQLFVIKTKFPYTLTILWCFCLKLSRVDSEMDNFGIVGSVSGNNIMTMSQFAPHRFQNPSVMHQNNANSVPAMDMLTKYMGNTNEGTKELNYYNDQTIATVYKDENGIRCNLIEVNTEDEKKKALDKFAQDGRKVEYKDFQFVLSLITACQALDYPSNSNTEGTRNSFRNEMNLRELPDPKNVWSVTSGILPGTKWCGIGDIAKNYDDLGEERNLDKCCRSHDYCPVKVKAFRSVYGLVNWSLYTKSHCQCDDLLYKCLKNSSTPTADILGNFYFNIARVQCVDEESPTNRCVERDIMNQKCTSWEPTPGIQKRVMFRSAIRKF